MFTNPINDPEWKKIIAKEFMEYKKTRKQIREVLIKENYNEKDRKYKKKRKGNNNYVTERFTYSIL